MTTLQVRISSSGKLLARAAIGLQLGEMPLGSTLSIMIGELF